jgi:hypothetical protein
MIVQLGVDRERIAIGDAVTMTATIALRPGTREASDAIIDYRVHYIGPRGARAPKVFKLARRRVTADEPVTIRRRHRFAHVSIRRIHPGRHRIDLQVNGRVLGSVDVDVVPGPTT